MNQQAVKYRTVHENLETAIGIGCSMVTRSKEVRKNIKSRGDNSAGIKESLKELDRMSIELIDKLVEINARIDHPAGQPSDSDLKRSKIRLWLETIRNSSRRMIDKMRLTYQDIYTL